MNVNKLCKEGRRCPRRGIPKICISRRHRGPASAYDIYIAYFPALPPARPPGQEEQQAQSSFSSTYPFIGLSHEMKGPGMRLETRLRRRRRRRDKAKATQQPPPFPLSPQQRLLDRVSPTRHPVQFCGILWPSALAFIHQPKSPRMPIPALCL